MKVTVMPILIGTLGTMPKCLVKGLEGLKIRGQVETTQTTALLRLARILRSHLRWLEETCCHWDSSERPSANAGVKKSQIIIIMNVKEWRKIKVKLNNKILKLKIMRSFFWEINFLISNYTILVCVKFIFACTIFTHPSNTL